MATYDFGSVTGAGSNFGATTTHTATTATDTGISFTFTSNGPSGFGGTVSYDGGGAAIFVGTGETATLQIVDTDIGEEWLSSVVFSFSGFFDNTTGGGGVAGDLQIRLSNTKVTGQTTTITLTGSQSYFANGSNYIQIAAPAGQYNTFTFLTNNPGADFLYLHAITGTPNCFLPGTAIATPRGDVAVEALQQGDRVVLADGSESTVKWVGRQWIDTRLYHPAKVNPVCISAGALGDGLPKRDLFLSGDHAVAIDGTLYTAASLINDSTIYRLARMPREGFTYFHVETDAHELIVAEGVAAESFIDYAPRGAFDNAAAAPSQAPIAEMALPRVSTPRLVPAALKARLDTAAKVRTPKAA